jgi:hypothetical protein
MENDLKIDVANLDVPHRRALEEVIGRELAVSQRLIISVIDAPNPRVSASTPGQSLGDWTGIYDGLDDAEIEAIDQVAKSRANFTRIFP